MSRRDGAIQCSLDTQRMLADLFLIGLNKNGQYVSAVALHTDSLVQNHENKVHENCHLAQHDLQT